MRKKQLKRRKRIEKLTWLKRKSPVKVMYKYVSRRKKQNSALPKIESTRIKSI